MLWKNTVQLFSMRYILYTCLLLLLGSHVLNGQPATTQGPLSIAGRWEGVLTQNRGGFVPEYRVVLILSVSGDEVAGFSEVWYGDTVYVKSEVRGTLTRGVFLDLEDHQVLNRKDLRDFDYCRKTYQLVLDKARDKVHLRGRWQGKTEQGPCIPGSVRLERRGARV